VLSACGSDQQQLDELDELVEHGKYAPPSAPTSDRAVSSIQREQANHRLPLETNVFSGTLPLNC
jgi:hypothetical protein